MISNLSYFSIVNVLIVMAWVIIKYHEH